MLLVATGIKNQKSQIILLRKICYVQILVIFALLIH